MDITTTHRPSGDALPDDDLPDDGRSGEDRTDAPTPPHDTADLRSRARRAVRWTGAAAVATGLGGAAATVVAARSEGDVASVAGPGTALSAGAPLPLVAALVALAALLTCAGTLLLAQRVRLVGAGTATGRWSPAVTALAAVTALPSVVVLTVVCDSMPLAAAGYLPLLLVGALFSAEMREALGMVAQPGVLAQLAIVATTVVVVTAVLAALDAVRGTTPRPRWLQPAAAARWGRGAVVVAAAIPLLYAFTRVAWVLGWSVGFDADAYTAAGGDLRQGLVLAAGAVVGAVLTTGLVRPWGERFWSWLPVLGGRPVPVWLAVAPAAAVAALLVPAGASMVRAAVEHSGIGAIITDLGSSWAAVGITFLWPVWGVALAVATLGYALRRRRPA